MAVSRYQGPEVTDVSGCMGVNALDPEQVSLGKGKLAFGEPGPPASRALRLLSAGSV